MKKIGIDMRLYSQTGVGVYLRNLLYELVKILPHELSIYLYVLPEDASRIRPDSRLIVRQAPFRWHSIGEQSGFFRLVQGDKLDIMHFTYFGYPILYRNKFIATVHDITPLLFQTGKASTKNPYIYWLKHKIFSLVLKTQVLNAFKIITPTNTVRQQLVSRFGSGIENKIVRIYEGVNYELRESCEDTLLYETYKKPFLLYVGNFYPHKNLDRLIRAMKLIKTNVPLLLVGPNDFFAQRIKESIRLHGLTHNIFFHHSPGINELHFFYKHAIALIHPTLSEGFGLPLTEAAYFGVPVIASDIPVIRELLGTGYTAFNPENTEDIAEKINGFIAHPVKPDYKDILSKYSFRKMAEETLSLYLSQI